MTANKPSAHNPDRDLFYLTYAGELHISQAVRVSTRINSKVSGTLCNSSNWHAIRPLDKDIVRLPICVECQSQFDIIERGV